MRPITFLSDYGHDDDFVGVCHAVIARGAPDARVVDITHGVPRHDVRTGALVLRRAVPYAPPGVHLAVVDPGVGGARRAVAIRCAKEDRLLVGPDNGLLALAAERFGGAYEAVDVGRSPHRLEPVSATFHGRDLFAPVAAALAAGAPLGDAGSWVETESLATLDLPAPRRDGATLLAHALGFDRYGNVTLEISHDWLIEHGLKIGRALTVNGHPATYGLTFADVAPGALLVYEDAYRTLALAVNRGSARDLLALDLDDELRVAPA
ncbi:MAG: SAM hydrolase/SAM-dependent halogenase family protein [Solirubrobacteraceae bacterium]